MDLYFRRHSEWLLYYNCSFYDPDSWPREERVSKAAAWVFYVSGVIEAILYLLIIYVLCDKKLRQNFCYRLMLLMALFDLFLIPAITFATGYFLYYGMVYCDHPVLIYFIGQWLLGMRFLAVFDRPKNFDKEVLSMGSDGLLRRDLEVPRHICLRLSHTVGCALSLCCLHPCRIHNFQLKPA
uniref:G protein-coupled receptor n=1 Tax=Bursaphelenchus xylophilus TaxID=6326 RepID=A0A1I7RTK0_BURXY